MTSEASAPSPRTAFVWVWLPGAVDPVVAGRLDARGFAFLFTYGRSYLERAGAVPLYLPELPLGRGSIEPLDGLSIASCLRDAGPDAWGQRVILARHRRGSTAGADTAELDQLTYLLESGSDRIGALDFQTSATDHVPRVETASLTELQEAATALEEGRRLPEVLETALVRARRWAVLGPRSSSRTVGGAGSRSCPPAVTSTRWSGPRPWAWSSPAASGWRCRRPASCGPWAGTCCSSNASTARACPGSGG